MLAFLLLPVALMANGVDGTHTPLVTRTTDMSNKLVKICTGDGTYNESRIISLTDKSVDVCHEFGPEIVGKDFSPFTLDLAAWGAVIFERWLSSIAYTVRNYRSGDPMLLDDLQKYCNLEVCVVIMNGNRFERLERVSIQENNRITRLDLAQNNIKFITVGCFRNLKRLQVLRLDSNNIINLEKDVFAGLENIRKISLAHNKLTKCAMGVFSGLGNFLESIDLGHNKISEIEEECFNSSSLHTLSVRTNSLKKIDREMFEEVPNIEDLDFSFNNITDAGRLAFRHLKYLDLFGNRLAIIKSTTFKRLPKLETLHLGNCGITLFMTSATAHFNRLKRLDLKQNQDIQLEDGSLSGCLKKNGCKVYLSRTLATVTAAKKATDSHIIFK